MKIVVETPKHLKSERVALANELIELLRQQQRSCLRYANKMQTIRNKLERIDNKLNSK